MKQKELGASAKSLSDMIVSSKIEGSLEDVIDFDSGTIEISLLDITAKDSNVGLINMPVLNDINEWCQEKLVSALPENTIDSISITLKYDSNVVATNKDKLAFFHLGAECTIKTSKKQHVGQSNNKLWYSRHA